MELRDVLHYGYMPPKVRTDVGNDEIAQGIVDFIKIHLAFTRDYRMVCKQNGQEAKDSVDIVGTPSAEKKLCSEIKFSKDLATGGVVRYECIEHNKKVGASESVAPTYINEYFNKRHDVYDDRYNLPISQVVKLEIPPCFVEEK